jgi:hypothetical protein
VQTPVDFTYAMPYAFTGKIKQVTVELKRKSTDMPRALSQKEIQSVERLGAETRKW